MVAWVFATGSPPRLARFLAVVHDGEIISFYIQSLQFDALFYVFAGTALAGTWEYLRRQDDVAKRMRGVALEIERESERLAEARFAILNAQIEPHFLFNSLANVKHLYRADAAAADAMFESLLQYLDTALPALREDRSTLSCELALVEAYLGVHKVRMGGRLRYDIDVPSALRDAQFPPLTLLTLVENAIKHGVSPRPEGGRVWISACLHERELVVAARDDGVGLDKPFGSGAGLANVRARMKWLYGAEGGLTLGRNEPTGMVATLRLPYLPNGAST
jgi:LytS/YehU family sensor histidine kinase